MSKLRRDVHVPNEADAFVFISAGQRGRVLMPGEAAWNAAVASCDLMPLLLAADHDTHVGRILALDQVGR